MALQLRFDEHGNLLTRLPQSHSHGGAMPAIAVDDASVVIKQMDGPDFHLSGINATLNSEGNKLTSFAIRRRPRLGKLVRRGNLGHGKQSGLFCLHSDSLQLSQDRLVSLPGVPKTIWEQLQATGEMATEIRNWRSAADQAVQTRVSLTPKDAAVENRVDRAWTRSCDRNNRNR